MLELGTVMLKRGNHKSIEEGACIMEMVSYMASEPWSDHPKCACPILTAYAIRLNDEFSDNHRQKMKAFIPSLIGTRATDQIQVERKRVIRWRNVTAMYPLILDALGLKDIANNLRQFENTIESMAKAKAFLEENKEVIKRKYAYPDANAYAYADAYAFAAANAIADANANAFADAYGFADAYANANAYANPYANPYAYAYAFADAYANPYANANANAIADAFAAANAIADANANALREKIVEVSLETLRLAILVGKTF